MVGDLVEKLALGSSGKLNPVAAFLGGLVGHEVIKASSGKYKPLSQFAHFDFVEALSDAPVVEADCAPCGSRYDGQIAVFGKALQAKIAALNVFMVGAGALGCEFIKNFALMGVGTGDAGSFTLTDMDEIEKSNLNRQFLFRNKDIGHLKSEAASRAVSDMNAEFASTAWSEKVAPDTEAKFNDDFWDSKDLIVNALDNVEVKNGAGWCGTRRRGTGRREGGCCFVARSTSSFPAELACS